MGRICITETDKENLEEMINNFLRDDIKNKEYINSIQTELDRAAIISSTKIPENLITMEAKVVLSIGDAAEEEYQLVYPEEADIIHNKISILAPIGTAILGYREGDTIDWKVPEGFTLIKIKKIVYQKEAAEKALTD